MDATVPHMKIEDRLAQLERLVEAVATTVPADALPSGFWGKVSDTHFITRSKTEEYGYYNLLSVRFDGEVWNSQYERDGDQVCQVVPYRDVPSDVRWV